MQRGYSSQRDYMDAVQPQAAQRQNVVEAALREAFSQYIEKREVEVVVFSGMSAVDLANAIQGHPVIVKPLLACCNIAARALERDLKIRNLDTYAPRLDETQANIVAGYVKPFLPPYLELPALVRVDRIWYIDKEIRKGKGRWEHRILESLNRHATTRFRKRKFEAGGESFELDAAAPTEGPIEVGIDVKRIEARRDIHKRCDEIVNKAAKLKTAFPDSRFGAVIYYPFIDEHSNIQSRLRSTRIDGIVFASDADDSITNATRLLLSTFEGTR